VEYSNQPNPAIYRDPPYGPNALGPGDVIATNLKSVGGTTGNVFGQLIRLILGLPNLALSLLKPLVVGAADTLAQTTDAAAGVTQQAAKSVPVVSVPFKCSHAMFMSYVYYHLLTRVQVDYIFIVDM
jgi:hypothetical protein